MPWWSQDSFVGGINEKPEEAGPNQVRDARNMWAPDGRLVTRPGYRGAASFNQIPASASDTASWFAYISGAFVDPGGSLLLSSAPSGSLIYVGYSATFERVLISMNTTNTNAVGCSIEYSRGDGDWLTMPGAEIIRASDTSPARETNTILRRDQYLVAPIPGDWATDTVNSLTKYFIRIRTVGAMDSSVTLDHTASVVYTGDSLATTGYLPVLGMAVQFPDKTKYFMGPDNLGEGGDFSEIVISDAMNHEGAIGINKVQDSGFSNSEPVSYAADLANDRLFFSMRQVPYEYDKKIDSIAYAEIETDPFIVGTVSDVKQEFHPDYVVQLNAVPGGRYWEFFNNQVWTANLPDAPFMVRWSGPGNGHKVWPTESFEQIVEDDNSHITGLKAFGEHLAVFKRDSIWRMTYGGLSGLTGLNTYIPVKVPGGIGTVSNASIVDINGVLMFLAEDGVYAFDGVNKPSKVSDPIDGLVAKISSSGQSRAIGIHWRTQNLYLLSVAIGGSEANNMVLAYDYSAGAWWVWDDIEAQLWINDEGPNDEEQLFFVDSVNRVFHLGSGTTDNGTTIDDWVQLHRIGYGDYTEKTFREMRVMGQGQDLASTNIEFERDDSVGTTSATLDWRSSNEPKVGDTGFVADGTYTVSPTRRDSHKLRIREDCEWLTVKITNDENKPIALDKIALKVALKGIR